jgi:hypothetical protein
LISCDLQFHVLEKHVVHIIFNYNPYSIVNERWIAKIDAERNPPLLSPLMLAVTFSCGGLAQPDAGTF